MHLLFVRPPFVLCFLMCTQYISAISTGRNTEEDLEWSCTEQRESLGRGWTAVLIGDDLSFFKKKKKRRRTKTKKRTTGLFHHLSNPLSVRSAATVAFPVEWVLVRDANVFMDDVAVEYCWAKPPFIHGGEGGVRARSVGFSSSRSTTLRMMGLLSGFNKNNWNPC